MEFHAGSFPKLRHLQIWGAAQLNQVRIEESALKILAELWFTDCPELKFLPDGIQHLAALERLGLKDTSEELIEKLRQNRDSDECSKDAMKISHIRNVTVALSHNGFEERIRGFRDRGRRESWLPLLTSASLAPLLAPTLLCFVMNHYNFLQIEDEKLSSQPQWSPVLHPVSTLHGS